MLASDLQKYRSIAEALVGLLAPYGEVVLHDLMTGTIAAIFNSYSGRQSGDPSELEQDLDLQTLPDVFEPYRVQLSDGRVLRSTTATLRNDAGDPIGLLCVNIDITILDRIHGNLGSFLLESTSQVRPKQLFADDWRGKIEQFVHTYCSKNHVTVHGLKRPQKKELVFELYALGAFRAKGSADHVAAALGISRATVYKYLADDRCE